MMCICCPTFPKEAQERVIVLAQVDALVRGLEVPGVSQGINDDAQGIPGAEAMVATLESADQPKQRFKETAQ